MAERWAVATGNWSATGTWNGGTLPGSGDDVYANNYTVTIDQNVTVASVRTTAGTTPVAGGGFTLNAGYTLTGNVIAGSSTCVTASYNSPSSATITGSVTGSATGAQVGVLKSGTGTLTINGAVTGGTGSASASGLSITGQGSVSVTGAVSGSSAGGGINGGATGILLTVVGNCVAGSGGKAINFGSSASCTVNITGNVTGGSATGITGVSFYGSSTTVNITGTVTGGSNGTAYGVSVEATGGILNVYGTAVASSAGTPGVYNAGNTPNYIQIAQSNDYPNSGTAAGAGSLVVASGYANIDAMIFGSGGAVPISGRHFVRNAGTNYVTMRESNAGATLNMGELSADYPTQANVRSGVSFDFGNKTGTCAVPAAGSVAFGVAVDNTTGTAALSPTALLGADLKTRLENCATVQTVGDQLAALGV